MGKRNPLPPEMYERVMREETCCRLCGADAKESDQVHHICNRGMAWKDHARGNLCRLCFRCHHGLETRGKISYPRSIGQEPLVRGEEE